MIKHLFFAGYESLVKWLNDSPGIKVLGITHNGFCYDLFYDDCRKQK